MIYIIASRINTLKDCWLNHLIARKWFKDMISPKMKTVRTTSRYLCIGHKMGGMTRLDGFSCTARLAIFVSDVVWGVVFNTLLNLYESEYLSFDKIWRHLLLIFEHFKSPIHKFAFWGIFIIRSFVHNSRLLFFGLGLDKFARPLYWTWRWIEISVMNYNSYKWSFVCISHF
jgi:hypothetical protein